MSSGAQLTAICRTHRAFYPLLRFWQVDRFHKDVQLAQSKLVPLGREGVDVETSILPIVAGSVGKTSA